MKIRDVEVVVLAAPGDYGITADGAESHGPKYTCVFLVHTDEGLTSISQIATIWGFQQLAEEGGVDILQPDTSRRSPAGWPISHTSSTSRWFRTPGARTS